MTRIFGAAATAALTLSTWSDALAQDEIDPCCPPVTAAHLKQVLPMSNTGWGPYSVRFAPTPAFEAGVRAYINYLVTQKPTANFFVMFWNIEDCGADTVVVNGRSAPAATSCSQWHRPSGTNIWQCSTPRPGAPAETCAAARNVTNPFPELVDILQPGVWYKVTATLRLPGSTTFWPAECSNPSVYFHRQSTSGSGSDVVIAYQAEDGTWNNDTAGVVAVSAESRSPLRMYRPGEPAPGDSDAELLNERELNRLLTGAPYH